MGNIMEEKIGTRDWLVMLRDENGDDIEAFVLEGMSEAEAKLDVENHVEDMGLTVGLRVISPVSESVKDFLAEWGHTDEGMQALLEELGYRYLTGEDISEDAINEDWVWIERHGMWVEQTSVLRSDGEQAVAEYLIGQQ
jgi:hypothetical protein